MDLESLGDADLTGSLAHVGSSTVKSDNPLVIPLSNAVDTSLAHSWTLGKRT
jgi:hypothetical protein